MSYTGLIAELPLGRDGLTGNKNLSQIRPEQLLTALNLTYESGTLSKEGGAAKYNSTAITGAPKVIGGWDWWPTDGVQRMVVFTDAGTILKDDGSATFATTLKSGLTVGSNTIPVFVEAGKEAGANDRKLFIFTGNNAVQVLSGDGVTTANLATPPADWTGATQPVTGANHEGRLWGLLGHRAYYSNPDNHEDFTGAGSGSLNIYPGEGEAISMAFSFKGVLVVVKKPVGVYLIDTSSATLANWRVVRLTAGVGSFSSLAWCVVDDDVLFQDQGANFQLISAVSEFGDLSSRNLSAVSEMEPFIRENINLGRLAYVKAVYYAAKREAHFAIAGSGATKNTRRLVVDFNRSDLPRFRFSDRDTPESLWMRKDGNNIPRPVHGDDAGFVWNMDQATKSKAGVGYNGQFQIPHNDLSQLDPKLGTVRKQGDFLECVVEPTGNWNMSVDVLWDAQIKQTVQFNMGVTGATLGSFILGTDKLAGSQVVNKKRRITGTGRRISLIGRNSGAAEDFSVAKFLLHFRPVDERL